MDYSEWLTPARLAVEEAVWVEYRVFTHYADYIRALIVDYRVGSILELGCGTGWVPTLLPDTVDYTGVDANLGCLTLAREKTPRVFLHGDIRTFLEYPVDLVCAFAVLKHFALAEWRDILRNVLQHGRLGLFSIPIGEEDKDDLTQGFPHTFVSRPMLESAVTLAAHEIVFVRPVGKGAEMMVATRRVGTRR